MHFFFFLFCFYYCAALYTTPCGFRRKRSIIISDCDAINPRTNVNVDCVLSAAFNIYIYVSFYCSHSRRNTILNILKNFVNSVNDCYCNTLYTRTPNNILYCERDKAVKFQIAAITLNKKIVVNNFFIQ